LAVALILPSTAFGFSWRKAGGAPLVKGGVHSTAKFRSLMHNAKVRRALRGVIARDGYPSWVFDAAVAQSDAWNIHSSSLARGKFINTMAFGTGGIRYASNTFWRGRGRLPYYYVSVSRTTQVGDVLRTETYRVALARSCCNAFVLRTVTESGVLPPVLYNLNVEKRLGTETGPLLGGFEVTGTVAGNFVSVTTTDTTSTLVAQVPEGTPYSLTESLPLGWEVVSPPGGTTSGVMPAGDVTIVFVNRQILPPLTFNLNVEKRQDSLEGTRLAGWEITGTVGGEPVSVTTTDTTSTLVGSFPEGTPYDLSELLQAGYQIVSPPGGSFTGTMPASDITLTYVNSPVYTLSVEKRQDSVLGTMLAGWEITGTVGTNTVDVFTNDTSPTIVGTFTAGTPYSLTESLPVGWTIVSPPGGNFSGTMPATNVVLTYVNSQTYPLYVEKRLGSPTGPLLGDWEVTGTVDATTVDVFTNEATPTLIGSFPAGTPYSLTESLPPGWEIVSPAGGNFTGTMPATSVVLTYVNRLTSPPETFALYVEKRLETSTGPRLSGWEITGTVGADLIDVFTETATPTFVGNYTPGTFYSLVESLPPGWTIVGPPGGIYEGSMPATDLILTYVNSAPASETCMFFTKGFWAAPARTATLTANFDWIQYANTLPPYAGDPFTTVQEAQDFLVSPVMGDPRKQLAEQLLAFIFNVRNCNAKWILVNGQWVSTDVIIQQAIDAWVAGDGDALAMEVIIAGYNSDVNQTIIDP
jgi:hypothetical protein